MRLTVDQARDRLSGYILTTGYVFTIDDLQDSDPEHYGPIEEALEVLRDAPDFPPGELAAYREVLARDAGLDRYLTGHGLSLPSVSRFGERASVRGVTELVTAEEREALKAVRDWLVRHKDDVLRIMNAQDIRSNYIVVFPTVDDRMLRRTLDNPSVRDNPVESLTGYLEDLGMAVPYSERSTIMAGARALNAIAERQSPRKDGLMSVRRGLEEFRKEESRLYVTETELVTRSYSLNHEAIYRALRYVDAERLGIDAVDAFYRDTVMGISIPPETLYDLIVSSPDYALELTKLYYLITNANRHHPTDLPLSEALPQLLYMLLARVMSRRTLYKVNFKPWQLRQRGEAFRFYLRGALARGIGRTGRGPLRIHQGLERSIHPSHRLHHHGPSIENAHGALFGGGLAFAGAEAFAGSEAMMMLGR